MFIGYRAKIKHILLKIKHILISLSLLPFGNYNDPGMHGQSVCLYSAISRKANGAWDNPERCVFATVAAAFFKLSKC